MAKVPRKVETVYSERAKAPIAVSRLAELLPHMWEQAALFQDTEDPLREVQKVILITFVSHSSVLKADREGVALLHRLDPFFQLDLRQAFVDQVPTEDAMRRFYVQRGSIVLALVFP